MLTAIQDAALPGPPTFRSAPVPAATTFLIHASPSLRDLPRHRTAGRLDMTLAVSPLLRPMLRAFLLGYASAVGPRLLTLLLQHLSRRRVKQKDPVLQPPAPFLESFHRIVRAGFEWQRFPTFCAVLVGGTTILEVPLRKSFEHLFASLSATARTRLSRALAAFAAAWLSARLLQSKKTLSFRDIVPVAQSKEGPIGVNHSRTAHYAGRTLDLTLFALTRAADVIVGSLWAQHKSRRLASRRWTKVERLLDSLTDPLIFVASCALIMRAWFYSPASLPRAYTKWISSAAAVDPRLITALQEMRARTFLYGHDTGRAELLQSMCRDYGWPKEWGDPALTAPIPCEMVHMGTGPSCETHALSRFARSWRWAMATYLPLNLLLVVRHKGKSARKIAAALVQAVLSAARSSAFLGTFIALFYYGVCLARTRIGPAILGTDLKARHRIDGGICVGAGCALCGWSILIENAGRRKDIGLFVAPRALATLLPRRYGLQKQWRETAVFAASTAVVFTCALENPKRVRGVLGTVLGSVLQG